MKGEEPEGGSTQAAREVQSEVWDAKKAETTEEKKIIIKKDPVEEPFKKQQQVPQKVPDKKIID